MLTKAEHKNNAIAKLTDRVVSILSPNSARKRISVPKMSITLTTVFRLDAGGLKRVIKANVDLIREKLM